MSFGRHGRDWVCRVGALVGVVTCLAVQLAIAQPAPRVEAGRIEARIERNYARLVFTFTERPRHQVNAQLGVLVLRFDRPVDVNIGAVVAALPGYVNAVRRDADGTGLRFALSRRVRVNTTEAGDQLYVDLLPEPWAGSPPALPPEVVAEMQRRAEEAERLRLEELERQRRQALVGPVDVVDSETPTFTRLAFHWRTLVAPTIERSERTVRIVFDKLGTFEIGPLRARLPRFVEGIDVTEEDFRSVVTLTIDAERNLRSFVEGVTFSLDIEGPERERGLEAQADGSLRRSESRALATPPGDAPAAPSSPQQPAPRPVVSAAASVPVEASAARAPTPPVVAGGPRSDAAPQQRVPAAAPATLNRVEGQQRGTVAELRLQFSAETGLAAFIRDRTLWIVAESKDAIDPEAVRASLPRLFRNVARERVQSAEVLRITLDQPMVVSVLPVGADWTVFIGDMPPTGTNAVDLLPRLHADGRAFVTINVPRPQRAHRLSDPLIGDQITVVTALGPGAASVKPQRFVEFELLQTAHGLAIREGADDLIVRFTPEGVVIDREAGLSVTTNGLARTNLLPTSMAPEQRTGFVDFDGWKLGEVDRYTSIRNTLIRRVATAPDSARTTARLDLARFYISHALGIEALSYLNFIAREDPAIERDQSFRILRGAAAVLAGRYDVADRDLGDPDFEENGDVALWRGLAAAARHEWGRARRFLARAQPMLGPYPRAFQARVLHALIEANLEMKDIASLPVLIEEAQSLDNSPRAQVRVALLRGRLYEATGRTDHALDQYTIAANGVSRDVAAEATFRRVALAQRIERMSRAEAIGALTSLALGWRGGSVEIEAYRLLARLHVAEGNYREAFAVMRSATLAAPQSDIVRDLQDQMREAFADLFLEGRGQDRGPLDMLALFYDYRELTPPGRRGDELIRNLADRLVDVDLLDQAIELLAHQVDRRLQGAARAEVATHLAFVHLMNREPDKAIQALRRTRLANLPSEMEKRRNLIEARALASLGRAELAIELLGNESSEEARRLRGDLLWEGRRWGDAAAAYEALLGDVWRQVGPLSDVARADVLRIVVGYALAGNQTAIDRMRTRYSARMGSTPEAAAFAVLTARTEAQGTEFRAMVRALAQPDTMQRFLREYRERWRGPPRQSAPQASTGGSAAPRG